MSLEFCDPWVSPTSMDGLMVHMRGFAFKWLANLISAAAVTAKSEEPMR